MRSERSASANRLQTGCRRRCGLAVGLGEAEEELLERRLLGHQRPHADAALAKRYHVSLDDGLLGAEPQLVSLDGHVVQRKSLGDGTGGCGGRGSAGARPSRCFMPWE